MDFSTYKAVLFDVDKTLTNSKKEITEETITAVRSLVEKKIKIGVCGGRHFATLQTVFATLFPPDSIHVVCGGGQVIQSDGTVVWSKNIPAPVAQSLADLATKSDCRFLFQAGDTLFGNPQAIAHAESYFLSDETYKIPLNLSQVPDWGGCALITVGDVSDEFISEVRKLPVSVKEMSNYQGQKYIDITDQGVNKSVGIREWCLQTGIAENEIIGFGDSENDIEFLQTVGHSVAMGNAVETLKAVADEVTLTCDQNGVANWIQKNIV